MLFDDLICLGSEFQRVRSATVKARVPVWVLTMVIGKRRPYEWSPLGLGRESMSGTEWKSRGDRVTIIDKQF